MRPHAMDMDMDMDMDSWFYLCTYLIIINLLWPMMMKWLIS